MHRNVALILAVWLVAGLLGGRAQSSPAPSVSARAEFRDRLARCSPAVLVEICTNAAADRVDPSLCDAVRSLTSNNSVQRSSGEQGLSAIGLESGMALLMQKLGDRAAGGSAIRWMASNATPVSVGLLLDSYDRTVSGFSRGALNEDAGAALAMVRRNSLAALNRVYGADLARELGSDPAACSTGLVALAIVQFSREKWFAYKAAGMPDRRWEMERTRLFEWLAARAAKAD